MSFRLIISSLFLTLISFPATFGQEKVPANAGILFYNVENLFNPDDNEGKDDEAFRPDGDRRWTHKRKEKKQSKIARVILHAGKWDPPALVGLCEVEDRQVLDGLIWNTGLDQLDYNVEHYESPDERGIDVALLYRKDRFVVLSSKPVKITTGQDERPTRDILYVKGILDHSDTLHVMVNHWPSRWGGEAATQHKRIASARVLSTLCDSVLDASAGAKLIAMGDFNDGPSDKSVQMVSGPSGSAATPLINLASEPEGEVPGTIRFRHQWDIFDQIMVSENLLTGKEQKGYLLEDQVMEIISPDFLLEKDPKYPGVRPDRTYVGFRYKGGYSDHLPVMIRLSRE
ncbi:MAG: endonuclease [Marinilabilia sp.]